MRLRRAGLVLAAALLPGIGLLAGPAAARLSLDARDGTPPPLAAPARPDLRCTEDGRTCIRADRYVADVCAAIERHAADNALDPHFLARLLWKESRFEPTAVSPAGAQGIAQFMPGTARQYQLHDPFNPAAAIARAAWYLGRLRDHFGSIGIAAVAYNGGEARAARFMGGGNVLPFETQDYVEAITGHNAWRWRDDPPDAATLDLSLEGGGPFASACRTLAGNRTLKEFATPARAMPWGVIVASHPSRAGAVAQVARLNRALAPLLGQRRVTYVHRPLRPGVRAVYTAQIGHQSESDARTMCLRLRSLSIGCIVLRN